MSCVMLLQPLQELEGHRFSVQLSDAHVSEANKGRPGTAGTDVHVSGMSVASHDEQSLLPLLSPPLAAQALRMLFVKIPARAGRVAIAEATMTIASLIGGVL